MKTTFSQPKPFIGLGSVRLVWNENVGWNQYYKMLCMTSPHEQMLKSRETTSFYKKKTICFYTLSSIKIETLHVLIVYAKSAQHILMYKQWSTFKLFNYIKEKSSVYTYCFILACFNLLTDFFSSFSPQRKHSSSLLIQGAKK